MCVFVCFFFKQKTSFEMRISDWSSDVCSSDLTLLMRPGVRRGGGPSCVFYSVRHGVSERRQKKVQVGLARVRRTLLCGQGRVWFRSANRATTCDDCAPRRDKADRKRVG